MTAKKLVEKIVKDIFEDVSDRGFYLNFLEDDIQKEIKEAWAKMIAKRMAAYYLEKTP